MREIKFRGKRLENGEWAYGNYIHFAGDGFEEHHITSFKAWEDNDKVDPETVGQYTGLKDKNGKKIYEGDILRYSDGEILGVAFDNKTSQFTTKTRWLWTIIDVCEIIGNIHENPELLEDER
jgi:uncharacterized phage protein (TIGR01671 family)